MALPEPAYAGKPAMSTFQIDFSNINQKRIIGIDLGTTNSLAAFMDLTGPEVIAGADGGRGGSAQDDYAALLDGRRLGLAAGPVRHPLRPRRRDLVVRDGRDAL